MPFINIDKNKNQSGTVAGTASVTSSANTTNSNLPTKDPESITGGLIQKAYTAEPADGEVKTQVEDGVKIVSKPFGTVDEKSVAPASNTDTTVQPAATNTDGTEPVIAESVAQETQNKVVENENDPGQVEQPVEVKPEPASEVPLVNEETQSSTPYPSLDSVKQADQIDETPVSEVITGKIPTGDEPVTQKPDDKLTVNEKFEAMKTASNENAKAASPAQEKIKPAQEELVITPQISGLDGEVSNISEYMDIAVTKNASDVHFTAGYPVHLRVDGKLQKLGVDELTNDQIEALVLPILSEKKRKEFDEKSEVDLMYEHSSGNRFRVNIFKERGTVAGAFRLIPKKVRTIEELNLPQILKEFSRIPYGLVVVTGPTGSGKSTTIAAMIEEINRTEARHIITIEDPVEYVYEKRQALIAQRNMYEDTKDWTGALRSVLRQDPNVVVIGEMRDYETIASALTIAETGHLVFATLHTNSASQTIDRIIDVFPEGQQNQVRSQLSSMLSGVISQRLIPLKNGGRKAAVELLIGTIAVKNAIREGKTHQIDNIIQTSSDIGMIGLEKSLVDMVRSGDIDIEVAKAFSAKPDEIDLLLK